jgi:hypothetical protein
MLNALGPPPPAVAEILALPSQPHAADSAITASSQPGSHPGAGTNSSHLLSSHAQATADLSAATQPPDAMSTGAAAASSDDSAAPMAIE